MSIMRSMLAKEFRHRGCSNRTRQCWGCREDRQEARKRGGGREKARAIQHNTEWGTPVPITQRLPSTPGTILSPVTRTCQGEKNEKPTHPCTQRHTHLHTETHRHTGNTRQRHSHCGGNGCGMISCCDAEFVCEKCGVGDPVGVCHFVWGGDCIGIAGGGGDPQDVSSGGWCTHAVVCECMCWYRGSVCVCVCMRAEGRTHQHHRHGVNHPTRWRE